MAEENSKAPLSVDGAQKLIERLGVAANLPFKIQKCQSDASDPITDSTGTYKVWLIQLGAKLIETGTWLIKR